MTGLSHLEILRQGRARWNAWRSAHADVLPDLRGACLQGMDLSEFNLSAVNFRDGDLSRAKLVAATLLGACLVGCRCNRTIFDSVDLRGVGFGDNSVFPGASFRRAVLFGAMLTNSDLERGDLRDADLRQASLTGANLRGADCRGAELLGADLRWADLAGTDLRGADLRNALTEGARGLHQPTAAKRLSAPWKLLRKGERT